ncbi:MAG TPA: Na(+)/H(+) antiporter subunit D [Thermoplasmata archaeon]|nr:Na(+)/H(+) antiporter subunit D [Thermoplasmata archaeon]
MDLNAWFLVLTVLMPFLGAYFILVFRNRPNVREGASLAAAILTFAFAALSLPRLFAGGVPASTDPVVMFLGLSVQLTGDGLGLLFAVLASFLWILTTVYSVGYMRGLHEHAQTRYYACFALVIGATMGVALSSNLFSLFLFYEILTVATYPLVVHKESEEAFAAGRKYLVYTLSGGVAILAGMMLLQGLGGSLALAFTGGGNAFVATISPDLARLGFVLLFAGFGVKSAIMPLHGWLPSAMIAPTPVSGLLHAVAVVKAGVFGELRLILFLFGPAMMVGLDLQWIVIAAAAVTVIGGSLLALVQDDFKARLAYSTISQLNYITLGAALLVPLGYGGSTADGMFALLIGVAFMIAAHAFGKLTMFFVAGAVAVETGKTRISQLDGIGKKMPREFVAFALAALSMICLPPMAGFVAKWYISVGAWNAGFWWIPVLLVVSSVLNLGYWLPILIRAFFRPYDGEMGEARPTLGIPLLVTAAGALLLGIWTAMPYGFFEIAQRVAADVTGAAVPAVAAISVPLTTAFPPFLIFLIGGPLVLLLKGRARQVGLIILAGIALLDIVFLPMGTTWNVPFMGYQLQLLKVDSLSYLTGLIFGIITFFAVLYAAGFAKPWMHLFALLYAGTSLGAVFAGDWITMLFFWELMAITSTLLIMQGGEDGVKAGFRYFLYHVAGGALLAGGIALLFFQGGGATLAVGVVSGFWPMLLITLGIGLNAAFIPLHSWLPDAYPRAHFVASVFLSVYTTKTAVYAFARMFLGQPDPQPAFEAVAVMGAIMAVYGVSFAVFQSNMRRLLSYHIVSQVGYMIAGVGLAGWLGMADEWGVLGLDGGMAHVFNHILYKALLFMTIGVVIWKTGENTMNRLGGLQRKMPITAFAFWVAAFSISGVPLFNGYISKGMVIFAAEDVNVYLWLLLEIASFGTFLSFLKLGWFTFLRPAPEGGVTEASDPPLPMQVAMLGVAALCIAIGVYPQMLYNILPSAVPTVWNAWAPVQLGTSLLVLGLAAAFFFTIGRKALAPHDTRLKDVDVAYGATAHATISFSGYVQSAFRLVYEGATDAARGLFALGRRAMGLEDRDVNWNMVAFGGALVVVLAAVLLGVGA